MDDYVSKPIHQADLYEALRPYFSPPSSSDSSGVEPSAQPGSKPDDDGPGSLIDWPRAMAGVENDQSILAVIVEAATEELSDLPVALEQALSAGDAPVVQRHAHTIKSTSRTFGATALADCAERMEHAAADNDLEQVKKAHPRFQSLVGQFLAELQAFGELG